MPSVVEAPVEPKISEQPKQTVQLMKVDSSADLEHRLMVAEKVMKSLFDRNKELEELNNSRMQIDSKTQKYI